MCRLMLQASGRADLQKVSRMDGRYFFKFLSQPCGLASQGKGQAKGQYWNHNKPVMVTSDPPSNGSSLKYLAAYLRVYEDPPCCYCSNLLPSVILRRLFLERRVVKRRALTQAERRWHGRVLSRALTGWTEYRYVNRTPLFCSNPKVLRFPPVSEMKRGSL